MYLFLFCNIVHVVCYDSPGCLLYIVHRQVCELIFILQHRFMNVRRDPEECKTILQGFYVQKKYIKAKEV